MESSVTNVSQCRRLPSKKVFLLSRSRATMLAQQQPMKSHVSEPRWQASSLSTNQIAVLCLLLSFLLLLQIANVLLLSVCVGRKQRSCCLTYLQDSVGGLCVDRSRIFCGSSVELTVVEWSFSCKTNWSVEFSWQQQLPQPGVWSLISATTTHRVECGCKNNSNNALSEVWL